MEIRLKPVQDMPEPLEALSRASCPGQFMVSVGEPHEPGYLASQQQGDVKLLCLLDWAPEVLFRMDDEHGRRDPGRETQRGVARRDVGIIIW